MKIVLFAIMALTFCITSAQAGGKYESRETITGDPVSQAIEDKLDAERDKQHAKSGDSHPDKSFDKHFKAKKRGSASPS